MLETINIFIIPSGSQSPVEETTNLRLLLLPARKSKCHHQHHAPPGGSAGHRWLTVFFIFFFLRLRAVRTRSRNALLEKRHFEFTEGLAKLKGDKSPYKTVISTCKSGSVWLNLNQTSASAGRILIFGAGFDVQYRKPNMPAGEPRKMKKENPNRTPVLPHFFPGGSGRVSRERHRY